MKLIKPYYEIIEQQPGEIGMLKHIEAQGRVAWKSEDRITDDSYLKFVEMLKGVNHGSVLEHGTVYMLLPRTTHFSGSICFYENNQYTKVVDCKIGNDYFYAITTNYRVLIDGQDNTFTDVWQDLEELQCEPTEFHEKRVTVKFNTQIAITREGNRHRDNSITESSTRYCNYSKDKFGNELTINLPDNITDDLLSKANSYSSIIAIPNDIYGTLYEHTTYKWLDIDWWLWANACAELAYMKLIEKGWTAQQARTILPLDTNTEVVYTAFVSDWKYFFHLRCAPGAHIDIRNLAIPLEQEFKHLGLL
jgi:thymidylate synthase (FAD)